MSEKPTVEIIDSCFHLPEEIVYNSYFEGLNFRDDQARLKTCFCIDWLRAESL